MGFWMIKRDNKSLSLKQTTQFLPLRYLSSFHLWDDDHDLVPFYFICDCSSSLFIIENLCLRFWFIFKGWWWWFALQISFILSIDLVVDIIKSYVVQEHKDTITQSYSSTEHSRVWTLKFFLRVKKMVEGCIANQYVQIISPRFWYWA